MFCSLFFTLFTTDRRISMCEISFNNDSIQSSIRLNCPVTQKPKLLSVLAALKLISSFSVSLTNSVLFMFVHVSVHFTAHTYVYLWSQITLNSSPVLQYFPRVSLCKPHKGSICFHFLLPTCHLRLLGEGVA